MSEIPVQVKTVLDRLRAGGYEAYLVGGCVRDRLMGAVPKDYDVTTSALPEQTRAVFAGEKLVETGIRHGTVLVLLEGVPVEVTTYRVDGGYSDARHPDAVRFTPSLTEDLARRDFTVNAMAEDGAGNVVDPFGGRVDLSRGLLRCVGDPDTRFREDALRILRGLRFSAALGFRIEPATVAALRRNRELLRRVSAERVRDELFKMLCGRDVRRILLTETDTLGVVLPELLPMRGFDQRNPHHIYDVLEHTAAAVEAVPPEPALRLAALLHDAGKPACFSLDGSGVGHFYGHPAVSAALADAVLRRLRADNALRDRVTLLVKRHDVPIEATERSVLRALRRMEPEAFFQLLALKRADNLAQSPAYRDRQGELNAVETLTRQLLSRDACFSLKDLAVNGQDLIQAGMRPGKELGKALDKLLDAVIDGKLPNERDALLDYLSHQKHGI